MNWVKSLFEDMRGAPSCDGLPRFALIKTGDDAKMSVFPKTVAHRANVRNRIRLKAWLSEWALDRSIRKTVLAGHSEGSKRAIAALAESSTSGHFIPAEGHIFVLPPVSSALLEDRLLYVLVLRQVLDVFLVVL